MKSEGRFFFLVVVSTSEFPSLVFADSSLLSFSLSVSAFGFGAAFLRFLVDGFFALVLLSMFFLVPVCFSTSFFALLTICIVSSSRSEMLLDSERNNFLKLLLSHHDIIFEQALSPFFSQFLPLLL